MESGSLLPFLRRRAIGLHNFERDFRFGRFMREEAAILGVGPQLDDFDLVGKIALLAKLVPFLQPRKNYTASIYASESQLQRLPCCRLTDLLDHLENCGNGSLRLVSLNIVTAVLGK